jgi:hypothetical protein
VAYELFRAIEAAALDTPGFDGQPDLDFAAPGRCRVDGVGFTRRSLDDDESSI